MILAALPEVFTGVIGLVIFAVAAVIAILALFMPCFVWGIYQSNKQHSVVLQDQLEACYRQNRALEAILEAENQQIRILWDMKNATEQGE